MVIKKEARGQLNKKKAIEKPDQVSKERRDRSGRKE